MTATVVENETNLTIEEEYDKPTPCVWTKYRNCNEAKWLMITPCCFKGLPYCQKCLDNFLEKYPNQDYFICRDCCVAVDKYDIRVERL